MLSPIVEYLLAYPRTGGGVLCYTTRVQFLIPIIPPGVQLNFSVAPPYNAYAAIKFAASLANLTVPGTILMTATCGGNTYINGFIEPDWEREYLGYFLVFTPRAPIRFQLTNTSPLNQTFVGTQWSIAINTEEDYKLVIKLVTDYASSIKTDQLLCQANDLLKKLVIAAGGTP